LGHCWAQIRLDGDTVLFTASTPIERSSIIARSLKIVRKWGAALTSARVRLRVAYKMMKLTPRIGFDENK
jgi:hypothetical protein